MSRMTGSQFVRALAALGLLIAGACAEPLSPTSGPLPDLGKKPKQPSPTFDAPDAEYVEVCLHFSGANAPANALVEWAVDQGSTGNYVVQQSLYVNNNGCADLWLQGGTSTDKVLIDVVGVQQPSNGTEYSITRTVKANYTVNPAQFTVTAGPPVPGYRTFGQADGVTGTTSDFFATFP